MLNLMRRYAASPALVFRAFAEPQLLEHWLCPDPSASLRVEHLDFRVGGTYRLVFTFPDAVRPVIGEYLVIDPPNLLRFTWTWEPPDEFAGLETVVTVSVRAANAVNTEALRILRILLRILRKVSIAQEGRIIGWY